MFWAKIQSLFEPLFFNFIFKRSRSICVGMFPNTGRTRTLRNTLYAAITNILLTLTKQVQSWVCVRKEGIFFFFNLQELSSGTGMRPISFSSNSSQWCFSISSRVPLSPGSYTAGCLLNSKIPGISRHQSEGHREPLIMFYYEDFSKELKHRQLFLL